MRFAKDKNDNIKQCNRAVNIEPSEGDYCLFHKEIIRKTSDGNLICKSCYIKCIHSSRPPIDCLFKTEKANVET